jgi:hypothetical protein
MCIACELGYWSMVDALAAERKMSMKTDGHSEEAGFACETPGEPLNKELRTNTPESVDEPHRE